MKTGHWAVVTGLALGLVFSAGSWMPAQTEPAADDAVADAIGGMQPVEGDAGDRPGGLYVNPAWFEPQEEIEPAEKPLDGGAYAPGETGSMADGHDGDYVPAGLVEAIWPLIDRNDDGRGTDREIYLAIRASRVLVNADDEESDAELDEKEAAAQEQAAVVRQQALALFDANANGLLDRPEAIRMLALVRGARCPTAQRALAYWEGLDANDDLAVVASEIVERLDPLGPVGLALAGPLGDVLEKIDLNRDDQISKVEAYYSANALLRVQLATEGNNVAGRSPAVWMRFVGVVSALDADADNLVSTDEAAAEGMMEAMFRRIDTNNDQYITPSEMCDLQDRLDAQLRAALAAAAARNSGGMCGG